MLAAASAYPGGYDWRYQTISVLLYSDQNPHGFVWAWLGLWLCGLLGFVWTWPPARRVAPGTTLAPANGLRVLQLGFLFMCCAVLPDRLLPWSKGHELFAILAFLGICIGMTRQLLVVPPRRSPDARRETLTPILAMARLVMPWLAFAPLVIAGLTQAYLDLQRPELPWVTQAWRALGITPLLSFGLWEWVSCAVFTACLLVLWNRRRTVPDRQ
jgi:hypothetical protein